MAIVSEEDRARMGTVHPQLTEALKKDPFPDLTGGDPNATRGGVIRANRAEHLKKLRHLYPIAGPIPDEVEESEHEVPTRDGSAVRVRTYVPRKKPAKGSPVIVMFHEGGWIMGDLTDEDQNCRLFSRDLGAVCVNVEYRLAPEHPFPTGVNDCYDVIEWIASSAPSNTLPGDLRLGFIVGGSSAGGNLSAVMCQIARDQGLSPPITGQNLCVPALLSHRAVPEEWKADYRSRQESQDDPVLRFDKNAAEKLNTELKPDDASPLYSPLLHPNFRNLPPAFFQVCGLDPLRDEGLIYESVLKENGVETKLDIYDGFGHMFWTNWPTMERSKEFVADTREGIRWLLDVGRNKEA